MFSGPLPPLQLQPVSDHGDELRVCGLSLGVAHSIAEEALKGIQVASVPGYLDGVANGALDAAGGGLEGLRHLRVQYLRDGVDDIHVVDGNDDRLTQVLVSLDVGGNADFMDEVRLSPHGRGYQEQS